jgi:transposase
VDCEAWWMGTEKMRVWRTAAEKRRIVELTLQPGMSVARVSQAEGANLHQVFQWRLAYRQGTLGGAISACASLLPAVISEGERSMRNLHRQPPVEQFILSYLAVG